MQTTSCSACSRRLGAGLTGLAQVKIAAPRRRQGSHLARQGKSDQSPVSPSGIDISVTDASTVLATAAGLLSPLILDVHPASAHDVLLQGKIVSLVHPALMLFLFGATAWTGWLGLQWR